MCNTKFNEMEKILKLSSSCRTTEANSVVKKIISEYNTHDFTGEAYFTGIMDTIISTNDALTLAIERDTNQSELDSFDEVADNAFTSLYFLSMGLANHPDEAISKPAKEVFKLVDKYGLEIKSKGYDVSYSLYGSLISDGKSEKYQASIASLSGCKDSFDNLEIAVNNFLEKQRSNILYNDARKTEESASSLKKNLIAIINGDLIDCLRYQQKANTAMYGGIAQFIHQRFSEVNAAVQSRSKKKDEVVA